MESGRSSMKTEISAAPTRPATTAPKKANRPFQRSQTRPTNISWLVLTHGVLNLALIWIFASRGDHDQAGTTPSKASVRFAGSGRNENSQQAGGRSCDRMAAGVFAMKPMPAAVELYRAPRTRVRKAEPMRHYLPNVHKVSGSCSHGHHQGCYGRNCTCPRHRRGP